MADAALPRVVKLNELSFQPRFDYGHMAEVTEVSGMADGTLLGTGFVQLKQAEIPWAVKYDEVILVLEGTLTVRTATGDMVAHAQECIWLPSGTELTYVAEHALVFYAIQPANWAEG